MGAVRIPPAGDDLEFVENTRTGTVHILPWDDGTSAEVPADAWGEAIAAWLTGPRPLMLCGTKLRCSWPGAPGQPLSEFPDEKLCRACVRVLGDQGARAFEHPQPRSAQDHR
jgi:hypothetical protein